jgi:hypothetical protein
MFWTACNVYLSTHQPHSNYVSSSKLQITDNEQFHLTYYVIVHSPFKFKQLITKIKYGGNC